MVKNVVKRQHLPTLLSMNAKQKAIKFFKENQGLLRTTEAMRLGIHPRTIYQLRDEGLLEQLAKGIYRLIEVPDFSEPDLVSCFQENFSRHHMLDFSLGLSRNHNSDSTLCLCCHSDKNKTLKT